MFLCWLWVGETESVTREKCRERFRLIGGDEEDQFELVDVRLQGSVRLDCHFCNEKDDRTPKIWYRQDVLRRQVVTEVQLDMEGDLQLNRVYVTPDHTLVVNNISLNDAGIYFCHGSLGEDAAFQYNYLLDVVNWTQVPLLGNLSAWRSYHNSALSRNVTVVTEWMPWGSCTSCNRAAGEMRRAGKCRVRQPQLIELSCGSMMLAQLFPAVSSITRTIPDFVQVEMCTGGCVQNVKTASVTNRTRVVKSQGSQLSFTCTG
ncbi:hypothetical protein L9F63_003239 [Diploptera punctata]|uniref:Ig-like domain-containing protein n=1 Tax=Diploptera punctata TaxID=6984 RepID=A0AAD7ZL88_DIPPU|nr:hypothetical protein L9F63_003239 [Diploptera punctata]